MADDTFEEMCCALLAKEPDIASADLSGRPREPQFGIDVVGQVDDSSSIVVVSCKCYTSIKRGNLSEWSFDFLNHWDAHWQEREVRRFILATAADVKSSARQMEIKAEKARFSDIDVVYEVWPPRRLQEKLRPHPGLVAQFLGNEWVPRLCGISGLSRADPKELLEKRWTHFQAGEFQKATECAEEAAQLARDVNDKKTLINALRCAARDLGDLLISTRRDDIEEGPITSRIASYLAELETLEISEAELALEKALLARLENRAADALKYAGIAEARANNPETAADALLVQLQSHWQLETLEDGLALKERIQEVTTKLEKGDAELALQTTWLRTLCKASKSTEGDVRDFVALVRKLIADNRASPARAQIFVDEVASEFGRTDNLNGMRIFLELASELAASKRDPLRAANIALQFAEVEAELGNETEARNHLGAADKWIDTLRSNGDNMGWASRKATALVARGRIESRLARKTEKSDYKRSLQHLKSAYDILDEALTFVEAHESDLIGDVGPFRADLILRMGDAATALGRHLEAADHYRDARLDQIMSDEKYRAIGMKAWIGESEALLFGGKPIKARAVLTDVIAVPWVEEKQRDRAQNNIRWIDDHVISVTEWFTLGAAEEIRKKVSSEPEGLRHVIAEQVRPLVDWFREFPPKDGADHAYSELIDIWGRGGLSRIVAAVQADPLNAISVDATSIGDIAKFARIFCPLYDTVIITWKGLLHPALGIVPMPDNLGPPGEFGGQGYTRTSDTFVDKEGWHAAVGWGNFLPKGVSEFLATEALPLIQSGRLVLLPAPLIGCTQSAVGWTDNLFVDSLLGGVVKIAGARSTNTGDASYTIESRLLDLGAVNVPFIDNVPLNDLDRVLEDTAEWLFPLRRLLQGTIGGDHLRLERWDNLRPYFADIRDAFRQLEERWKFLSASQPDEAKWRVADLTGTFSAAERPGDTPGSDPMTDHLRSVACSQSDLGPWIPFWRLNKAGGAINWTGNLDSRSTPPDEIARLQGFDSTISQGWLYPGDGGPGMATGFVVR